MGNNEVMYKDLIAFHPGAYIEEIIDELNITQEEFARRVGTSAKTISKLVNGEESISKDMANRLAKITGISIETWMNLQNAYDIKVLEIENLKNDDEVKVCNMIDFSYFKKLGLVKKKQYNIQEKIQELRKILNVANLSYLFGFNWSVSYRNTQEFSEQSIVNSNVLLELASNEARNKTEIKYNKKKLEEVLPQIREMTTQSPEIFYPKLEDILMDCGIVLIGMPKLKNANLNGATKKFKNGSVLLLITDRNKRSDIFWFSLIHELAHIYYSDFYSDLEDKEKYIEKENKADQFAQDFLIPGEKLNEFIASANFNTDSIDTFSKSIGIHPSILVGRLQNDGYLKQFEQNHFKTSYNFKVIND